MRAQPPASMVFPSTLLAVLLLLALPSPFSRAIVPLDPLELELELPESALDPDAEFYEQLTIETAWLELRDSPHSKGLLGWFVSLMEEDGKDATAIDEFIAREAQQGSDDGVAWLILARLRADRGGAFASVVDLTRRLTPATSAPRQADFSRVFDDLLPKALAELRAARTEDMAGVIEMLKSADLLAGATVFNVGSMSEFEARTLAAAVILEMVYWPQPHRSNITTALQNYQPKTFGSDFLAQLAASGNKRSATAMDFMGMRTVPLKNKCSPRQMRDIAALLANLIAKVQFDKRSGGGVGAGLKLIEEHFDPSGEGELKKLDAADSFAAIGHDGISAEGYALRWLLGMVQKERNFAVRGFRRMIELSNDPLFIEKRKMERRNASSFGGAVVEKLLVEWGDLETAGFAVRILRTQPELCNEFENDLARVVSWNLHESVKTSGDRRKSFDSTIDQLAGASGKGSVGMLARSFFELFERLAESDIERAAEVASWPRDFADSEATDFKVAIYRELAMAEKLHRWTVARREQEKENADTALTPLQSKQLDEIADYYLVTLQDGQLARRARVGVGDHLIDELREDIPDRLVMAAIDLSIDRLENFQHWDYELRGFKDLLPKFARLDRNAGDWQDRARRLVLSFMSGPAPGIDPTSPPYSYYWDNVSLNILPGILDLAAAVGMRSVVVTLLSDHHDRLPIGDTVGQLVQLGMHKEAAAFLDAEWPRINYGGAVATVRTPEIEQQLGDFLKGFDEPGQRFLAEATLASLAEDRDLPPLSWFLSYFHDMSMLPENSELRPARSHRLEELAGRFSTTAFADDEVRRATLVMLAHDPFAARKLEKEIAAEVGHLSAADLHPEGKPWNFLNWTRLNHLVVVHSWLNARRGDYSVAARWIQQASSLSEDRYQRRLINALQESSILPFLRRHWPQQSAEQIAQCIPCLKAFVESGKSGYRRHERAISYLLAACMLSDQVVELDDWWRGLSDDQRSELSKTYMTDPRASTNAGNYLGDADLDRRKRVVENFINSSTFREIGQPYPNWLWNSHVVGLLSEPEVRKFAPGWIEEHPWDGWSAAYYSWFLERADEISAAINWMQQAIELASNDADRAEFQAWKALQLHRAKRIEEARELAEIVDGSKLEEADIRGRFYRLLPKLK